MPTNRCSFIFGDDVDFNLDYDECNTEYCMDASAFPYSTGAFNYTQMMSPDSFNNHRQLRRCSSNSCCLYNKR